MIKILTLFAFCLTTPTFAAASDVWKDTNTLTEKIEQNDYGKVTSILILEHGNTVFEGYFNGANRDTLHNTRSVTKTLTSMLVGIAIDEGLLSLDTAAASLFMDAAPFDHPDPRKLSMTLDEMLSMSGVLECNDNDPYSRGNESRMHNVEDWAGFYWDLPIRGYPSWSEKPATAKYGRVFAYCSAGVEILGMAVERASDRSFQDYAKQKLFNPLGITEFEWQVNGLGQAHKSGGLALTTQALAKLGEVQRNQGQYQAKQIYSKRWAQESVKARVVADGSRNLEYGYLWWLSDYSLNGQHYPSYFMSGNGGNRVMVAPDLGLVVVVTKTDFGQRDMHQKTDALITNEILSRFSH